MSNQPLNEKQLQALLRLKRHEQPPPAYFDGLLHAIHRRQREELLRQSAWRIFFDRLSVFLASLRREWAYAGALSATLLLGILGIQIMLPDHPAKALQAHSDKAQPQENIAIAEEPSLRLSGEATFRPVRALKPIQRKSDTQAPTRFIIDAQPASYEHPQIRF